MITRRSTLLACMTAALSMTACTHTVSLAEGQHPLLLAVPGLDAPVPLWLHLLRGYAASSTRWPLAVIMRPPSRDLATSSSFSNSFKM